MKVPVCGRGPIFHNCYANLNAAISDSLEKGFISFFTHINSSRNRMVGTKRTDPVQERHTWLALLHMVVYLLIL
jgi:hypothetical protein